MNVWSGGSSLSSGVEKSDDGVVAQLLAALERRDLNHEEISSQSSSELVDKRGCGSSRTSYIYVLVGRPRTLDMPRKNNGSEDIAWC
jgi:hypothetical protein